MLKLGLLCSHPLPNARPCMRKVMQYLEHGKPAPDLSPTYVSYGMMALMQIEGFDSSGVARIFTWGMPNQNFHMRTGKIHLATVKFHKIALQYDTQLLNGKI